MPAAFTFFSPTPNSFERALAVHYATRLRNGRDWSGLEVLGGSSVSLTEGNQALDAFASRLGEAFHAEGGGRRRLKVESFARRDQDPAGGAPRDLVQFTIYVEGPPEIEMAFESDAEVIRRTTYPVAEAAIVFDETERALDVVEQGWEGSAARHSRSFSRHDDDKRCGDLDTRSEGLAAGKAQDTPHLQSRSRGPGAPS